MVAGCFSGILKFRISILDGIKDHGEFRAYAIERFRAILHTVVRSKIKTNSPIPTWAEAQVVEAWNVPVF
jgi:hypothetical protein